MIRDFYYCGRKDIGYPALPQTWLKFKAKLGAPNTQDLQETQITTPDALEALFKQGLRSEDQIGPTNYDPIRIKISDQKSLEAASEIFKLVANAAKFAQAQEIKSYFQKTIPKDSLSTQQFGKDILEIDNETYAIDFFSDTCGNLSINFSQINTESNLKLKLWFKFKYEEDKFIFEPNRITFANIPKRNKPQPFSLNSNIPCCLQNSSTEPLTDYNNENTDWNFQVIEDDPNISRV